MGGKDWLARPRARERNDISRGTTLLLAAIALVAAGSLSLHAEEKTPEPQPLKEAVRAGGAEPARFVLASGKTVIGRLVRIDDDALVIRRPSGGIMVLPLGDIVAVNVKAPDGGLMRGRIARMADGVVGWTADGGDVEAIELAGLTDAEITETGGPLIRYDEEALTEVEEGSGDGDAPIESAEDATVQVEPIVAAPSTAEALFVEEPGDATPSDTSSIKLTVTADETSEDDKLIYFRLTLSEPAPRSILIIYTTIDGSAVAPGDYTHRQGVVVFEPGQTQAAVATSVINDSSAEGDETFTFFVTGDPNAVVIEERKIAATIADDDG